MNDIVKTIKTYNEVKEKYLKYLDAYIKYLYVREEYEKALEVIDRAMGVLNGESEVPKQQANEPLDWNEDDLKYAGWVIPYNPISVESPRFGDIVDWKKWDIRIS